MTNLMCTQLLKRKHKFRVSPDLNKKDGEDEENNKKYKHACR